MKNTLLPRPEETKALGKKIAVLGTIACALTLVGTLVVDATTPARAGLLFCCWIVSIWLLLMGLLAMIYRPYTPLAYRLPIFGFLLGGGGVLIGLTQAFESATNHLRVEAACAGLLSGLSAVLFWFSVDYYRTMARIEQID